MTADARRPGAVPKASRDMSELFRQSAAFLRLHRHLIVVFAIVFAGLTLIGSQMMDKLYRSSVQLMIAEGKTGPGDIDGEILLITGDEMLRRVVETTNLTAEDHFRSDPQSVFARIDAALRGLQSPGSMALPEDAPPPAMLDAMHHLSGALSVHRQGKSDVIRIEVLADSPALAHRVATAVTSAYLGSDSAATGGSAPARSETRVISAASVPMEPVGPQAGVLVLIGLLSGSFAGIIVALARGALDTSLRTSEQIERLLALPVLAHLPPLPKGTMIPGLIAAEPLALFSDTIASLRHALAGTHRGDGAPVLLIASTGEYEGKTSIAAALAEAARMAEKNVLLIDGDLRRSELSARYDALGDNGLSDILQGVHWEMPVLRGSGNVDLLPAGVLNDLPLSALDSTRMSDLLARARAVYDLVVIDGPPVASVSDCAILSRHSDQILFVVRWGQTLRDQALRAVNRLPRDRIAGVVVNFSEARDDIGMGETYRLHSRNSARERADPHAKVAFFKDWDRRA